MLSRKYRLNVRKRTRCAVVTASVRQIKSPVSGKHRGYRLVAVVPNKAQCNPHTGEQTTSFRQNYLIAWMGDFLKFPSTRILEAFEAGLGQMPICAKKVNWE